MIKNKPNKPSKLVEKQLNSATRLGPLHLLAGLAAAAAAAYPTQQLCSRWERPSTFLTEGHKLNSESDAPGQRGDLLAVEQRQPSHRLRILQQVPASQKISANETAGGGGGGYEPATQGLRHRLANLCARSDMFCEEKISWVRERSQVGACKR